MVKIGIISGTGLENPSDILADYKEVELRTPFGYTSDNLACGKINGVDVVIIPRSGKKHTLTPTKINNRANIWALKQEGCTHLLATTACGSLREKIKPGHLIFTDQFIDKTTKRQQSFYGDAFFKQNTVCHLPMAEPFCLKLRKLLVETAKELKLNYHPTGTVITIEGPRFSTRAESEMFRVWGADVINMTTVPEVVLAREAGICYASIAMSTDYDCWKKNEKAVDMDMITRVMKENSENAVKLLFATIPKIKHDSCECREHIKTSLLGDVDNADKVKN